MQRADPKNFRIQKAYKGKNQMTDLTEDFVYPTSEQSDPY